MIAIIDYDTGNLRSVSNALSRLNAEHIVTADHNIIKKASHVLLPGVGEASSAMDKLRQRGLDRLIPTLTRPVLGICIGMQLMCERSDEGDAQCMGIFNAEVKRLTPANGEKIPHMGWDTVGGFLSDLFKDIPEDEYFYYVHSYAAELCPDTDAISDYCSHFSAALHRDNFYGCQFHPEKSGIAGSKLLNNFLVL